MVSFAKGTHQKGILMNLRLRTIALVLLAALGTIALVACAPTGVGDPCEPEVQPEGGFQPGETVLETSSLQCRTRVCMFYNANSFCTQRCSSDDDCNAEWYESGPGQGEVDEAYCEAEVRVGAPAMLGDYCVPAHASLYAE
jgi:hypothetical protein